MNKEFDFATSSDLYSDNIYPATVDDDSIGSAYTLIKNFPDKLDEISNFDEISDGFSFSSNFYQSFTNITNNNIIESEPGINSCIEKVIVEKFRCKLCQTLFDSLKDVNDHYSNIHSIDFKNKPDKNNATLSNINNKTNAKNKKKNDNETERKRKTKSSKRKKHACDWPNCTYVARYTVHLRDHKRIHTGEKPFRCTWIDCGACFNQASTLKSHIRIHTGERPYACEWPNCTMRFVQKGNLKIHQRIHTGERPFKCNWPGCEATFAIKQNLEHHQKVHLGLKQFTCADCSKTFIEKAGLKKHQLIHQDYKPFKCDWQDCDYRSYRRTDVKKHKIVHTVGKQYNCLYCEKYFARKYQMKKHIDRIHSKNV